MNKFLMSTALACALALPAAAATVAEGDTLADKQEYNFWLLDAIKTVDPQKNTDVEGSDILRQLFEGLMNEDAKGAMVPLVWHSDMRHCPNRTVQGWRRYSTRRAAGGLFG